MSEWKPFITFDLRGHKVYDIAVSMRKEGEKFQLWSYNCEGKKYIVAIYAVSFLSPLKFKANGFLVTTKNAEIVQNLEFCKRVVRDFGIWYQIYFYPVAKYVFFRKKYFSMLKRIALFSLEKCKERYEKNLYKNGDPAKASYNKILKELDLEVIQNSSLQLKNLVLAEKIIEVEKSIWQWCSCEKIEELRRLLVEYRSVCEQMAKYTSKRAETFYRYERAIRDAYKIDLQVSHYSMLSKAALSFLLWLANTNLYTLAVPFLPELLKVCYQTLVGYKALLKKNKQYLQKAEKIVAILDLFEKPIEDFEIRNLIK